jgi:hypothetical protein
MRVITLQIAAERCIARNPAATNVKHMSRGRKLAGAAVGHRSVAPRRAVQERPTRLRCLDSLRWISNAGARPRHEQCLTAAVGSGRLQLELPTAWK